MRWLRQTQRSERRTFVADGILLGTPTIVGEALKPIWDLTLAMFPATHGGKYAGAFGSYGWSGEGVTEYYAASETTENESIGRIPRSV